MALSDRRRLRVRVRDRYDLVKAVPAPTWSRTRATAWDLIRAHEVHDYDLVCGENIPDFATRWVPFEAWLNVWKAMRMVPHVVSFNAAHISGPSNESAVRDVSLTLSGILELSRSGAQGSPGFRSG